MAPLSVAVHGATGRVGKEIVLALCGDPDLIPVGAVSLDADGKPLQLPDGSSDIPHTLDFASLIRKVAPQVIVDFSRPEVSMDMSRTAIHNGIHFVVGTSGLTDDNIKELDELSKANNVGGVVAANFAIGAVLMIHMAKIAGKYFDYAEIIERHHATKVDAPSGTALATAQEMVKTRGDSFIRPETSKVNLDGARGGVVGGVSIHSLRSQGSVAHQEVIFGGLGQTLSVRHDTSGRLCYMPGVLLALKAVPKRVGVTFGLDALLGLVPS